MAYPQASIGRFNNPVFEAEYLNSGGSGSGSDSVFGGEVYFNAGDPTGSITPTGEAICYDTSNLGRTWIWDSVNSVWI